MRCNECGYMNQPDTTVCIKCGTKLTDAASSGQKKREQNPVSPGPDSHQQGEGAPTVRGQAANTPAWDEQDTSSEPASNDPNDSSKKYATCPSCGYYPLKNAPNPNQPCLNCDFTGEKVAEESTPADPDPASGAKTMKLGDMNIGGKESVVKIRDDATGTVKEFTGDQIALNRHNLAPNNNAISGKTHAVLKMENGKLTLEDKSSNGATFIQVNRPQGIESGTKVILGNKVFTIEYE